MRYLALIAIALFSQASLSCEITHTITPELRGKPAEVEKYLLGKSFRSATLVLEVTVVAVDHRGGFDLLRIRPETFWKSDGKPVEFVFPKPQGSCGQKNLDVGSRYIVFADRVEILIDTTRTSTSMISVNDVIDVPDGLQVDPEQSNANVSTDVARIRAYLAEMAVLWVQPMTQD